MNLGDEYRCRGAVFKVVRCFHECRSAIVQIERPLGRDGNRGTIRASMLVDRCRGVLIIGEAANLAEGIPLSAIVLRGNVGILADADHPECTSA